MDAENEDLYVIGHSKDLKLSKEVYDIRPKHNKEKNLWSLLLKMDEIKLQAKVTQDGNGKLQSFKDYVTEAKQQEQAEEIAEQWTYNEWIFVNMGKENEKKSKFMLVQITKACR